jgi:hypothetical protein
MAKHELQSTIGFPNKTKLKPLATYWKNRTSEFESILGSEKSFLQK